MRPLTPEQAENLQKKISEVYRGAPLEDKDVELLADLLHTEPILKALGRIRAHADEQAFSLINADLGKETERHAASRLQGVVHGALGTIDALIALASAPLPEDQIDVSTESAE